MIAHNLISGVRWLMVTILSMIGAWVIGLLALIGLAYLMMTNAGNGNVPANHTAQAIEGAP